jgi:hypothetical protein
MGRVRCVGAYWRYRGREGCTGDLSEISQLEELGIDKMKLFKLIFKK